MEKPRNTMGAPSDKKANPKQAAPGKSNLPFGIIL